MRRLSCERVDVAERRGHQASRAAVDRDMVRAEWQGGLRLLWGRRLRADSSLCGRV